MTRISLVVDSSSLMTPELAAATETIVVPVTITVDGIDHREGVDLDVDDFYRRLQHDPAPSIATAQPSPADFLDAYQQAVERGAESVVTVVVGSAFSGTHDSALVAARNAPVPVEVVDTGHASFGVSLCALAAAEAIAGGASAAAAADAARTRARRIVSVFIIQALDLARSSGRFLGPADVLGERDAGRAPDREPIPVLRFGDGELTSVGAATDLDHSVELMVGAIVADGVPIRVASGLADPATAVVTEALEARLEASPLVVDLLRYRVGPSVAASTGPGTAGVFYHPVEG